MRTTTLLLLSIITLHITSCKKKESLLETYDRGTLLNNIANNVISPSYLKFKNEADSLVKISEGFDSTTTLQNLSLMRNQWKEALAAWMNCEVYDIEVAYALNTQIAAFPVSIQSIETEIQGTHNIDINYVAATGTTRKGFGAIEYLLYGSSKTEQQIIDEFSQNPRRKIYLLSLAKHVASVANQLENEWKNGNPSHSHFISQTQMDISGSLNMVINVFVAHIEEVRRSKIGKPCGIEATSVADYSKLETPFAPHSIENIKSNIASWKMLFTGAFGIGIDDYSDAVNATYNNEKLSTVILRQMDLCEMKANAISGSLENAAINQPAQVKELHLELKKLTVLTKVDLSSSLGVVITFSDNDGD
jgi:predicted lipoprotein